MWNFLPCNPVICIISRTTGEVACFQGGRDLKTMTAMQHSWMNRTDHCEAAKGYVNWLDLKKENRINKLIKFEIMIKVKHVIWEIVQND